MCLIFRNVLCVCFTQNLNENGGLYICDPELRPCLSFKRQSRTKKSLTFNVRSWFKVLGKNDSDMNWGVNGSLLLSGFCPEVLRKRQTKVSFCLLLPLKLKRLYSILFKLRTWGMEGTGQKISEIFDSLLPSTHIFFSSLLFYELQRINGQDQNCIIVISTNVPALIKYNNVSFTS